MRSLPFFPIFLLLALLSGCAPALARSAPEPTTVIVVRHAERASETDRDSPLSPAGEARARDLVGTLAEAGVSAIYSTRYQRTRNTARPLAERLGLPIQTYDSADELAREIRARHAGATVLVVGHSNTVGAIVRAVGGSEVGELASTDYQNLFIVLVPAAGPARTIRARFGKASH